MEDVKEGTGEFEELETYLQEDALLAWSAPSKRKNISSSHFFDQENKRYPYRNSDSSVNYAGVMAAWKMAHGARSGKKANSGIISKIKPYRDRCLMKVKKKKQEEPIRRFSSPIPESFLEKIQLSEKNPEIDIQCLKMGKFRHPWYGVLKFDQSFFDSIMKNFEADIPNPEIAFDFRHMSENGAAAWVNKFFVEDNNLMANIALTEKGKQSLESKEFRYFSIEYTDDYVEYEFEEEVGEDGKAVDKETKISHGPTALGGGLTNRPFIKGMLPVSLHEEGEDVNFLELEEIEDNDGQDSSKEVNGSMKKTLEGLKEEQKKLQEKIKELEESKEKGSKEELKKLSDELKVISAEVKKLSDSGDDEAKKTLEELDETKKQLDDANKKLEEKDQEVRKLSDDVKALTESVKKLMDSNKTLHDDKHRISVEKRLEDLKKLGAFPSTIKVLQNVVFSESAKDFTVKLSEGEGDDIKEVTKTFMDIMEDVLASVPEEFRFSEEEKSVSPRTPTGGNKELSIEDVEKYAEEKKVTFEEALIDLSKEGKIE